jgi:hypothetical protein
MPLARAPPVGREAMSAILRNTSHNCGQCRQKDLLLGALRDRLRAAEKVLAERPYADLLRAAENFIIERSTDSIRALERVVNICNHCEDLNDRVDQRPAPPEGGER